MEKGGVPGVCLASPDSANMYCAFPDPSCADTGNRWGVLAGDGLASACVESSGATVTLTVQFVGTGQGRVQSTSGGDLDCSSTCSVPFPRGTAINLAPQADPASAFMGWSAPCAGVACSLAIDSDTTVTARFEASGTKQWIKQVALADTSDGNDVATLPDGDVAIVGVGALPGKPSGFVTRRAATSGEERWTKAFVQEGAPLSAGYFGLDAVETTTSGDLVVGGRFIETLVYEQTTTMASVQQAFVARIDGKTGALVWLVGLGDLPTADHPTVLAVDTAGDVYVANEFQASFSFAGKSVFPDGGSEIFVAKISSTGQPVWITSMGTSGIEFPAALTFIDDLDLVAVGGHFKGQMHVPRVGGGDVLSSESQAADVFIVRLAINNGLSVSSQAIGGNGDDLLFDLASTGDGDVLALGSFGASIDVGGGPLPGTSGTFVLDQSASGLHKASFSLLLPALEPEHIRGSGDGNLWLSGSLNGQAMLAGTALSGEFIGFAAKLARDGTPLRAFSFSGPGHTDGSALDVAPARAVLTGSFYGLATFADETLTAMKQSDAFVFAFVP